MENKLANQPELLKVTSSPHIRTEKTTQKIMLDVIIAMIPAAIGSVYFFGFNSLVLLLVSVATCVLSEYAVQKIRKKPITIDDLSAVVTGILIAFNVPATAPWWLPILGGIIAIVMVKQLFGGIGSNFVNPALIGRAVLLTSWPGIMTTWVNPGEALVDGVSNATPLAIMKGAEAADALSKLPTITDMFTGNIAGCLGETSALLILIGGIYLIVRQVIDWQTPVVYIVGTCVFLMLFGVDTSLIPYHLLGGGLFLGAFFMATDYSTTPVSLKGRIVFAIGCALLTVIIRVKGGMSEGVSYSILFMNIITPLIEKFTSPKVFGRAKDAK